MEKEIDDKDGQEEDQKEPPFNSNPNPPTLSFLDQLHQLQRNPRKNLNYLETAWGSQQVQPRTLIPALDRNIAARSISQRDFR
jgi:hypothetical protein